jgi:CHAD domain-containing protein
MNRRQLRVTSRLLARRARALKQHLPHAIDGSDKGVHQARVASRRLREAVPVLTAGVKGSKAHKALSKIKRVTKALGAVRELDVTLHVLDDLSARDTLPRVALERVRAHVVTERDECRGVMLKRMERVSAQKLERRLTSVVDAIEKSESEEWRATLGARLVNRSKALAAAIQEAGHVYAAEQLHRVRIAAKKLRYAMELAFDAGVKTAAGPVRTIKRAQDTLGTLHDLQILQTHVAAVQATPDKSGTLPDSGLEIIARALEDQCRHLHARYVAAVPKLTDAIAEVRTLVVPQLAQRAARRARPLKMTLKDRPTARRAPARAVPAASGQR